jgi:GNAT superfamily N-acetyltransferase
MPVGYTVRYTKDSEVSPELDGAIRALLVACFRKPEDWVFRERRYFIEPPQHRWYVPASAGDASELCAHLALHERVILVGSEQMRCGGVGEVAVAPQKRGQGIAKELLQAAHEWMAAEGFDAAILFGDPRIYASSGYRPAPNPIRYVEPGGGPVVSERSGSAEGAGAFMYRLLGPRPWPSETATVDLKGPRF